MASCNSDEVAVSSSDSGTTFLGIAFLVWVVALVGEVAACVGGADDSSLSSVSDVVVVDVREPNNHMFKLSYFLHRNILLVSLFFAFEQKWK